MALEINQQFNQFVRFAEMQANPAKSEAIARVTGKEDALAGRTITASGSDHVRGVFTWGKRSGADETKNDETRALFKKAVADIFGGEKNIPESVKKAMVLGDYNQGKPLTARRIMAVQKALRPYIIKDAVAGAVDSIYAINGKYSRNIAVDLVKLTPQEQQEAVRLVKRYGSGLNEWGLRALAKAVVLAIEGGFNPQAEARRVKAMIAPFRDFRPGDARFAEVDRRLLPHTQDILKEYMSPEEAWHFDEEGIFDNFHKDADRTYYTINGEAMNLDPKAVDIFKEKIPSVKHRKALSCFFSQMSMSVMNDMSRRVIMADAPGIKMFAGFDNSKGNHDMDGCETRLPRISLDISNDGKRATMTLENEGAVLFAKDGDIGFFCMPIGTFAWKHEIVFDLSGEDAVIIDTHVGQDLTVNAPNPEPAPQIGE